jgi:hypothetical protein
MFGTLKLGLIDLQSASRLKETFHGENKDKEKSLLCRKTQTKIFLVFLLSVEALLEADPYGF